MMRRVKGKLSAYETAGLYRLPETRLMHQAVAVRDMPNAKAM